MTLAQLCPHNQITEHPLLDGEPVGQSRMMRITDEERPRLSMCPGGTILEPASEGALKAPCPEGKYDAHVDVLPCPGHFADWPPGEQMSCTVLHELHCPGGTLLPPDSLIEVNVVAVRPRQAPGSDMFREPWLVTVCAVSEPEKPARYYLIPLDALAAAQPGRET